MADKEQMAAVHGQRMGCVQRVERWLGGKICFQAVSEVIYSSIYNPIHDNSILDSSDLSWWSTENVKTSKQ